MKFIPIYGHSAEYFTNVVTSVLTSLDIDIANCRELTTDNASNMAGHNSGLQ